MNSELIKLYKPFLPFTTDDIYLKDNQKQIKAVCSNNGIANFLADCVNSFSNVTPENLKRGELYKDFIKSAYFLSLAIKQSNIRVNSVGTILLEKVFNLFQEKLNNILLVDKISINEDLNKIVDSIDNNLNKENTTYTSDNDVKDNDINDINKDDTNLSIEVSENTQIDSTEQLDNTNGKEQTQIATNI